MLKLATLCPRPLPAIKQLVELDRLSEELLTPEETERFAHTLYPAVKLIHKEQADEETGPVVAQLGGEPILPEDFEWPSQEGTNGEKVYLSFVADIDLTALDSYANKVGSWATTGGALPKDGHLLFFYCDTFYYEEYPGGQAPVEYDVVLVSDPASHAGAKVIWISDTSPKARRNTPPMTPVFRKTTMCAAPAVLAHTEFAEVVTQKSGDYDHPIYEDAFYEIFTEDTHYIGGVGDAVQFSVEGEVANDIQRLREDGHQGWWTGEPEDTLTADNWWPLLQLASDTWDTPDPDEEGETFTWGDMGVVYFMVRRQDLVAGSFDRVMCTMQCS